MKTLKDVKKKNKRKLRKQERWKKINLSNLDNELRMNPSRMYNVGNKVADAEFLMEKAKAIFEKVEGEAKFKWSRKKRSDGKSYTIPQVDAKVASDADVIKAELDYLEAKHYYNLCRSLSAAMKEKGQQLTNLANNKRAELNYNFVKEGKEKRIKSRIKDELDS